jgi:hypothetical protein
MRVVDCKMFLPFCGREQTGSEYLARTNRRRASCLYVHEKSILNLRLIFLMYLVKCVKRSGHGVERGSLLTPITNAHFRQDGAGQSGVCGPVPNPAMASVAGPAARTTRPS